MFLTTDELEQWMSFRDYKLKKPHPVLADIPLLINERERFATGINITDKC